jgi:hypothetical protein
MQIHLSRVSNPSGHRCMVSGALFRTEREAQEWQVEIIDHFLESALIGPNDTGDLLLLQQVYREHFRPPNAIQ